MVCLSLFTQVIGTTGLLVQQALAISRDAPQVDAQLSNFIVKNRPVALQRVLDNIGPDGTKVAGAAPGLVIASPSKADPDYFFTWTRDSALTLKFLIDTFIDGDRSLEPYIRKYASSQARLQTVENPSGGLADGAGLGEPLFEANGAEFNEGWGRPQRDGPALRATALITYSNWLIAQGNVSTVVSDLWPIIRNDLAYVGQYWNQTGFDLWEEVEGSSFFTIAAQYRALVEGDILGNQIGLKCRACATEAPQILCFLQSFWNGHYLLANINESNGRSAIDANTLLGSIHVFKPYGPCEDTTLQPCSARALANHKVVTDSFRTIYGINSGIPEGSAVAVGRYSEDVYQGGHPWYLCTFAAAEQLYDALYQWEQIGAITVTPTSLPFFRDLCADIHVGTYKSSSSTYKRTTRAIRNYADGFLSIAKKYTPEDGALAEQFNRDTGTPLSAVDLTWSYTSFLTATDRRAGKVPALWEGAGSTSVPRTCVASSEKGEYLPPTKPKPCPTTPTSIAVTFNVLKSTVFGQNIFLTGLRSELGNGYYEDAIPLSADTYKGSNPRWYVTVTFPPGVVILYKYGLREEGAGTSLRVEDGDDYREYTVEEACDGKVSLHDVWNGK